MADQQRVGEAFTRLAHDIAANAHGPGPAGLAVRAARRRSRRTAAMSAFAVAAVIVGTGVLGSGLLSTTDQRQGPVAPPDTVAPTPRHAPAGTTPCAAADDSTAAEIIPGTTVTWKSSFHCPNAIDAGTYGFTVEVGNIATSAEPVTISAIDLTHTTPRPGGRSPAATGTAAGLPITVGAGDTRSFSVSGSYELVETDEGSKASLHFLARGHGANSDQPFELGINLHLRAPGATGNDNDPPQSAEPPTPSRPDGRGSKGPPADLAPFVERILTWADCVATEEPRYKDNPTRPDPHIACGPPPQSPGAPAR